MRRFGSNCIILASKSRASSLACTPNENRIAAQRRHCNAATVQCVLAGLQQPWPAADIIFRTGLLDFLCTHNRLSRRQAGHHGCAVCRMDLPVPAERTLPHVVRSPASAEKAHQGVCHTARGSEVSSICRHSVGLFFPNSVCRSAAKLETGCLQQVFSRPSRQLKFPRLQLGARPLDDADEQCLASAPQ